ncbi:putative membrane protein [Chitinophaga skermanii]|uniref:Putative membrane protein n=1 Tax=Chitinophaga skermanii TaxID=331697 RepID=A0A327QXV9_9BACT|nr:DoxX family protein [Chitinophaga skermanii]RAJ08574.1 putative membrane protein [Chitinophaga skermanii]
MPPWLPYHDALIYISGIAEIMLGIGLMVKQTRVLAAWGLIALLIAIFPANIQMAINFVREHHPQTWVAFARLPLQLLLIYWAYVYTKPIEPSQRISR